MGRLRVVMVIAAVLVAPVVLLGPRHGDAQTTQYMEISDSCLAVGQRIPALTVWGGGWDSWLANGGKLSVEWSWGGAPSTPQPASVSPMTQSVGGSFTIFFDVTGRSEGLSTFGLIATNQAGYRTLVGQVNMDIKPTCPGGSATCAVDQGQAVLRVEEHGYSSTWQYEFFYEYRKPDQVGPAAGTIGSDGAAHGEFRGLQQSGTPTVTARVYEPPSGDFGGNYYFTTFAAPICPNPPPTTASTAPATTSPTTAPTATTATTGPSVPTTAPTRTTLPGPLTTTTLLLPPPTPGASLTVTPTIARLGFVVIANGTGFPPGAVTLSWLPGIGLTTATAAADGTFSTQVLVFPKDVIGPRTLVAHGGDVTATAPFLAVAGSVKPSGKDVNEITRIRSFNHR